MKERQFSGVDDGISLGGDAQAAEGCTAHDQDCLYLGCKLKTADRSSAVGDLKQHGDDGDGLFGQYRQMGKHFREYGKQHHKNTDFQHELGAVQQYFAVRRSG